MSIDKSEVAAGTLLPLVLMSVLTWTAIVSRPPLPIDETRYLSVAWEMHQTGEYLVPHLNGHTYAHKPPLLFWLINLIWFVTGTQGWSGRLAGPAMACMSVILTGRLAGRLWPNQNNVLQAAPLIHCSMMLWMVFSPLTMFDALQAVTVQIAFLGILTFKDGKFSRGLWITGLGIGLGILAKGPVVLVHVLPLMLASPFFFQARRKTFASLSLQICGPIAIGAAIALLWALPAAISGGQAYGDELLWGQTAGRVVNSFSHRQPLWFYMPLLPVAVLPWMLYRKFPGNLIRLSSDTAGAFCMTALAGTVLSLSVVSGKQPYYLVPLLPLMSLVVTRIVTMSETPVNRYETGRIAVGTLIAGLTPLALNTIQPLAFLRLAEVCPTWYSLLLSALGVVLLIPARTTLIGSIRMISSAAVAFISLLVIALSNGFWQEFDVSPLAREIKQLQDHGVQVAWHAEYHGQVHFAGRLHKPIIPLTTEDDIKNWLKEYPQGHVVMRAVDDVSNYPYQEVQNDAVRRTALLHHMRTQTPPGSLYRVEEVRYDQLLRRGLTKGVMVIVKLSPIDKQQSSRDQTSQPDRP